MKLHGIEFDEVVDLPPSATFSNGFGLRLFHHEDKPLDIDTLIDANIGQIQHLTSQFGALTISEVSFTPPIQGPWQRPLWQETLDKDPPWNWHADNTVNLITLVADPRLAPRPWATAVAPTSVIHEAMREHAMRMLESDDASLKKLCKSLIGNSEYARSPHGNVADFGGSSFRNKTELLRQFVIGMNQAIRGKYFRHSWLEHPRSALFFYSITCEERLSEVVHCCDTDSVQDPEVATPLWKGAISQGARRLMLGFS